MRRILTAVAAVALGLGVAACSDDATGNVPVNEVDDTATTGSSGSTGSVEPAPEPNQTGDSVEDNGTPGGDPGTGGGGSGTSTAGSVAP